jgi:hypothetical protein
MELNISKNNLFISIQLEIYKKARNKLCRDFIVENPEIYGYMFKYEKARELLYLSIDKYFISWIDDHWSLFLDYLSEIDIPESNKNELREYFLSTYKELINKFQSDQKAIQHSLLFIALVKHKIKFISELLEIADTDQNKFNSLDYNNTKDKALFDRQINKLKEK